MTVAKSRAEAVATGSLSAAMQSGSHNARMRLGVCLQRRIQASTVSFGVRLLPKAKPQREADRGHLVRRGKLAVAEQRGEQMERVGRGRGQQAAALFADERHLQARRRIEAVHHAQLAQQSQRFVIATHENVLAVVEHEAALGIDKTVGASAEQRAALDQRHVVSAQNQFGRGGESGITRAEHDDFFRRGRTGRGALLAGLGAERKAEPS